MYWNIFAFIALQIYYLIFYYMLRQKTNRNKLQKNRQTFQSESDKVSHDLAIQRRLHWCSLCYSYYKKFSLTPQFLTGRILLTAHVDMRWWKSCREIYRAALRLPQEHGPQRSLTVAVAWLGFQLHIFLTNLQKLKFLNGLSGGNRVAADWTSSGNFIWWRLHVW